MGCIHKIGVKMGTYGRANLVWNEINGYISKSIINYLELGFGLTPSTQPSIVLCFCRLG